MKRLSRRQEKGCRVQDDESADSRGMTGGVGHSDGTTPIVHDQGDVRVDSLLIQQCLQVRDSFLQRIRILLGGRLVGKPASDVIGYHGTIAVSKSSDQFPIHEGPTGISVKHHQRLTLAFVQVVISIALTRQVVRLKIV